MDRSVKEILASYSSEKTKRSAEVLTDGKLMWANYYYDGELVDAETYENKSQRFYEDAAENYVNGIKKIESQVS